MSESIQSTIKNSELTLDSAFAKVPHSEGLGLPEANHIRFFHTTMRGNKLSTDNCRSFAQKSGMLCFSRTQLRKYRINDDLGSAVSEAMCIMAENGDTFAEEIGDMLGEIFVYAYDVFLGPHRARSSARY